jgi:hypothetical protein
MPFSRRKDRRREQGKADSRDPFAHLREERAKAEEEEPWFLGPDDGPELNIETGISSNLTPDDLEDRERQREDARKAHARRPPRQDAHDR